MKNKKTSKNVVSIVSEALTPVINNLGYRIWDIEYVKEGADYFLRFTIDNDGGIAIDDCEKVHREINPLLDELDPIEDTYYLQVSSPGLERNVKYEWHYNSLIGEKIEVRLFTPIEAYPVMKSFTGILKSLADGVVTLDADGIEYKIPLEAISKSKTIYNF